MKAIDEKRFNTAVAIACHNENCTVQELSVRGGFSPLYIYQLRKKGAADPKPEFIKYICVKARIRVDWVFGLSNIRERDRIT